MHTPKHRLEHELVQEPGSHQSENNRPDQLQHGRRDIAMWFESRQVFVVWVAQDVAPMCVDLPAF
jgi:hypothetical protein